MADTKCVIRRFAVDSSDWTAIVAPVPCSFYMVFAEGGTQMMRSSDPTNAQAQYTMPPGAGYAIAASHERTRRFNQGDTVTWIRTVGGSDVAIAEFVG